MIMDNYKIDLAEIGKYQYNVYEACKDANDAIAGLESIVKDLSNSMSAWHPVSEPTPDGLYLVKTDNGARYLQTLIDGKWMPNVVVWCPLPE